MSNKDMLKRHGFSDKAIEEILKCYNVSPLDPELRVTVSGELNQLLDKVVAAGIYQSKAELMRSGAIYLLLHMDLLKGHIEKTGNHDPSEKRCSQILRPSKH